MKLEELAELTASFATLVNTVNREWSSIYEKIGHFDGEITDLLHEIELVDLDSDYAKYLTSEIRRIRQDRRQLKDRQEVLRHLKEFADSSSAIGDRTNTLANGIRKTIDYQRTRVYTPRVRTDLKLSKKSVDSFAPSIDYAEESAFHN